MPIEKKRRCFLLACPGIDSPAGLVVVTPRHAPHRRSVTGLKKLRYALFLLRRSLDLHIAVDQFQIFNVGLQRLGPYVQ